MMIYEIPLRATAQTRSVRFPNGRTYQLRLIYQFNADNCWLLDISDAQGNALVCGIPLVTGCDLLGQFNYLGFGCALYCTTDGNQNATPSWYNLGSTAHLWLEV